MGTVEEPLQRRTQPRLVPQCIFASLRFRTSWSGHILVAGHEKNEVVAIDPSNLRITGRYPMAGIESPHGIALDQSVRLAFVAGEENHMLAVVDLNTMKVLATDRVGKDPDALAFDPGLKRLYVSAESGHVFVFREDGTTLVDEGTSLSRMPYGVR